MRVTMLMVGLTACGAASAGPTDLTFDIRRIDVGHPTAAVLVLDQDADGVLDVLVTGGGNLTVLRGNGGGAFEVVDVLAAGENPVDLAAGDIDGDGRTDLVIANHETSYLTLIFGGPDGLASEGTERLSIDVSPHPHAVALEDVDGDGFLDILVDDRDRERFGVYRGHGDGSFEPGEPVPVGGDPYRGMTLADINRDGHLDLLTPNPRTVAIQLGDGAGGFSSAPGLASIAVPPFSTSVGDFNGDGLLDVAAGSGEGPGRLMMWFGRGDGSFEPDPDAPYVIADGPTSLGASDVNGDGTDDVLVTSYLGDEVAIALGGQEEIRVVRIGLDDHPWGVAAGDLNGDGRMDLVTANDGGDRITLLLAQEGAQQATPGSGGDSAPGSGGDSALLAAAGQVGAFLRGNAAFESGLFADTVVLHVAPDGGGAQRAVPMSDLATRSAWTVGGYALLPPADDRELEMSVGRHLSCIEAPLATKSEALARMPHVGTALRPAEGGSCLQSWSLTLVFDTVGGSPRVVAALYDQWEW